MGLQLADVENDPLVQKTMQAFQDAIDEEYPDADFKPQSRHMVPQLDHPGFKILAEADALDSVSAAVLAASHFDVVISLDRVEDRLDKEVADVLRELQGGALSGDPDALFGSDNPRVIKLLVAIVAGTTTSDELKDMAGQMHPSELRMQLGDAAEVLAALSEKMVDTGLCRELPPKLMDKFIEGVDNIANLMPGRVFKKAMREVGQELRTEMAKAAAEELTSLSTPPQVDPDSRFEQLKDNARKFKPFKPGM
jgi:hypothetical protein